MLSLVVLLALLPPGTSLPPGTAPPTLAPPGLAPQEEVDILVYGVLQFSQALHETYGATMRQVEEAGHRLRRCQHSLEALQRQAHQARQALKELRRAVESLKAEEMVVQLQSHGTAQALRAALAGHLSLAQRVKELDKTLASLAERGRLGRAAELAALQAHVEQRSLTLRSLVGVAQQQRQQAARQAEQLAQVRKQVAGHTGART